MTAIIPLVDLKKQFQPLKKEVMTEIEGALDGMDLFLGENVAQLEREFADYCGVRFAVGVGSGTDALYLSLRAVGIGRGDEVITVANTFIATAEAIVQAGARPVFVDIDAETYTIDVTKVEAAITERTKAILPVHLYGHPADMDRIMTFARRHNLRVIEDACQAHGAEYRGAKVGTIGDAGAFSFYCSKNLGAYGEGGMVVTKDREIAAQVQMLRDHGRDGKYQHAAMGTNSRLDELQSAILRVKLRHLDQWNTMRRALAAEYNRQLFGLEEIVRPAERADAEHVYHLYVIRAPDREGLSAWLRKRNIATGVHYPVPVHLQQALLATDYSGGSLPVTESSSQEVLSLPMYPELTVDQVHYIAQSVKDYFRPQRMKRARVSGRPPARRPATFIRD
jgi:dTDP-4-amino-4,6-dideoxygalactose transaminase